MIYGFVSNVYYTFVSNVCLFFDGFSLTRLPMGRGYVEKADLVVDRLFWP